ncbi:MAG: putative toxin-antitoxin system toxin component, PIN family [Deltaproteobacteria bacterium]|nr:putative toxin-antitoxin system toxin component, PIN family [Deltaproteobacteria bacterium]
MEKRVVVDTNIVLSGFLSSKGAPAKILNAWVSQQFTPLVSLELKQEYFSVLEYRHIKERLASRYTRAHEMLTAIIKIAKFVNIKNPKIHLFSDTDDDILAEIAIQGKAHYISFCNRVFGNFFVNIILSHHQLFLSLSNNGRYSRRDFFGDIFGDSLQRYEIFLQEQFL